MWLQIQCLTKRISMGNRISAIVVKDLHYVWYLKILTKIHVSLGEFNLKEFSNVTSRVNFQLLKLGKIHWKNQESSRVNLNCSAYSK